jgi:glycine cleavage system H protein
VNPADLKYTAEHEWVQPSGDNLRIGITDYAQEALGDIVFVTLPAIGTEVAAGQSMGEVESTKSVSDVYAPLAGVITATNDALEANPELVNTDPYGEGWMVEIAPAAGLAAALEDASLVDVTAYGALTAS